MNQPTLNPDALEASAAATRIDWSGRTDWNVAPNSVQIAYRNVARAAVSAYLAAALPEVTSVEELKQLSVGTVIVINGTMLQAEDRDDYVTMWGRVRDIDAYPSEALTLPARVLYCPEVKP